MILTPEQVKLISKALDTALERYDCMGADEDDDLKAEMHLIEKAFEILKD